MTQLFLEEQRIAGAIRRAAWHLAAARVELASKRLRHLCRKAGFNPDQPRVPAGNSGGGQWTSTGGGGGTGSTGSGAPQTAEGGGRNALQRLPQGGNSPPPKIPEKRPPTAKERHHVIKEVAKWAAKVGARQLFGGPVGTALNLIDAASWLHEGYHYVSSYLDAPKNLSELQNAVLESKKGYDVHHIVEQTPADQDGFPRSMIDAPENLVRIPTLKHWQINAWYSARNDEFGGLSPRDYLRGKSWEEKMKVGRKALIDHGVLKP